VAKGHQPTEGTRRTVWTMVAFGVPQEAICKSLKITDKTLAKHYPQEIANAKADMLGQVAGSLFQQAVGRPAEFDDAGNCIVSEQKPYAAAGMFLMKTRAGWSEKPQPPAPAPKGGALGDLDVDDLTDEELEVLDRVLSRKVAKGE
jgi:hypothetical protein